MKNISCGLRSLNWAHVFLVAFVALIAVLLFATPGHAATAPSFSVADVQCQESAASCTVTVRKSAKANSYSKVTVTTADGSAIAALDYRPVSTTITFANSQLSASVAIPILRDALVEGNETFQLRLTPVRFATIAHSPATVTIVDDDAAPAPTPGATWTRCAIEDGICNIVGTANVRYGSGSVWTAPRSVMTSILCNNGTWGDPIPYTTKECQTDGQVGTAPAPTPTPTPTPTPPPATGSWAPAPLALGGYAFLKNGGPCCNGAIFRIVSVALSSDADPARRQNVYGLQFAADPSGQYPASSTAVSYAAEEYVVGVAPQ